MITPSNFFSLLSLQSREERVAEKAPLGDASYHPQRQHLHLHILHRLAKLLRFQPGLIPGFNPVLLSGFRVPVPVPVFGSFGSGSDPDPEPEPATGYPKTGYPKHP